MIRDQVLISLPPAMSPNFDALEGRGEGFFAGSDPEAPLGSGGGTANILYQAWRDSKGELSFWDWMRTSRKIVIHSGGQSRRLPAYAGCGKALIPVPIERGSLGQKFDQTLLDLQLESLAPVLAAAPESYGLVVLSGDVLLRVIGAVPKVEVADVACLGFTCSPDELQGFGAFFSNWETATTLDFAIQKPKSSQTLEWSRKKKCLADAGVWFLSQSATRRLLEMCEWDDASESFPSGRPKNVDLYGEFGLALGANPTAPIDSHGRISTSIFEPKCQFFHFGTSRQVLESATRIHQLSAGLQSSSMGFLSSEVRRANQHAQNVDFEGGQNLPQDISIWIENSFISRGTTFGGHNFVTGFPPYEGAIHLPKGACLDFVPVGDSQICVRFYGFDDTFSGTIGASGIGKAATWMSRPASEWFERRNVPLPQADVDIQDSKLFPRWEWAECDRDFVQWLIDESPIPNEEFGDRYQRSTKMSAKALLTESNIGRVYAQRKNLQVRSLRAVVAKRDQNMFYNMDIERAAQLAHLDPCFPTLVENAQSQSPAQQIRDRMFESEVARLNGQPQWEEEESKAFSLLKQMVVDPIRLCVPAPVSNVQREQIVWGRSPIRLDLAGGWTDTPPYSILHGGKVVNVAVELAGQPSVQVFARVTDTPEIILRSIDLGTQMVLTEFADLATDVRVGSEFALAKTALSLGGFSPEFGSDPCDTLVEQLRRFGGGLELSMLAAVPKGSGLGTSSVLSSTLLATIGSISGQNWTSQDVFTRVLASEQILTTGGGWQDQIGGALPGMKMVSSQPGVSQDIRTYWLPHEVLGHGIANETALLYYTGITRTAKGVLREIVRGMFMNSHDTVHILKEIGENTGPAMDAIMRNAYEDLGYVVRKSWELNRRLDSGTCPPSVEQIYSLIDDYVFGAKLLGAGGGGYMVMFCKDRGAATRVKSLLSEARFELGSRFVDFDVSTTGLTVTRS
jgi:galactokinase/mevalonate kinase-like predicted kinase